MSGLQQQQQQQLVDEFVSFFSPSNNQNLNAQIWAKAKQFFQLHQNNFDINQHASNGWTALTLAVEAKLEAAVVWLLEQRNINPNTPNKFGDFPLILAVRHGDAQINIARSLIQIGGAIYVQNSKGEDAREIAISLGGRGRRLFELLNDNIGWQLCKAYSLCTFDITGKKPITQESFVCITCDGNDRGEVDGSRAYCTACIITCHAGHEIGENIGTAAYCHCSQPSSNPSNQHRCLTCSAASPEPLSTTGRLVLVKRGYTFQFKEGVGFEFRPIERAEAPTPSSVPAGGIPPSLVLRWPAAMILMPTHAYFYSFWNGTADSRLPPALLNNAAFLESLTNLNSQLDNGYWDLHANTGLLRFTSVVAVDKLVTSDRSSRVPVPGPLLLPMLFSTLDYQIQSYVKHHPDIVRAIQSAMSAAPTRTPSPPPPPIRNRPVSSSSSQSPYQMQPNMNMNDNTTTKRGFELQARLDVMTKNLPKNSELENNTIANNRAGPSASVAAGPSSSSANNMYNKNRSASAATPPPPPGADRKRPPPIPYAVGQGGGGGQYSNQYPPQQGQYSQQQQKFPPPPPQEQQQPPQQQQQPQQQNRPQMSPQQQPSSANRAAPAQKQQPNRNPSSPSQSPQPSQQQPPVSPPSQAQQSPQAQPGKDASSPSQSPSMGSKYTIPSEFVDCILKPSDLRLSSTDVMGDGSFAVVYRGDLMGTPVAVKRLKNQTLDPKQLEEFNREVAFLRAIRHPNIVLFMGVTYAPYMIVTELLDTSLYKLVHEKRRKLSPTEYLYIGRRIAMAVNSLHERNPKVIHRDLKSLNVLLSDDLKMVKLCDLGLVRLKDRDLIESKLGSPLWMAPEMLRDEGYTEKVDVFAFAMIMYEMTTNLLPFKGEITMKQLIDGVAKGGMRPPFPNASSINASWRQLIEDCWQHDPNKRPDMNTILTRLQGMNF